MEKKIDVMVVGFGDWSCGRYKLVGIDMVDEMGNLKKS